MLKLLLASKKRVNDVYDRLKLNKIKNRAIKIITAMYNCTTKALDLYKKKNCVKKVKKKVNKNHQKVNYEKNLKAKLN